ncbi:MAG: hypothetical protein J6B31_04195 [Bacteroidaceae bacterium]|nr:hypothetical protein [Bacteroidaceae bacterium]
MIEDINQASKKIEFYFSKIKVARMYLQMMDDTKPLVEQKTYKLFIKAITPLYLDTLCYVCKYNITTIYKHLLLSGQAPDSIFFIKELSASIYESLLALNEYEQFIKEHFSINAIKKYEIKKSLLQTYKDNLRLIRNKSVYHIDKDFRIYFDRMLELFNIPILDIWNIAIEFIEYIQFHNKKIMITQINSYKPFIYDNAILYIQKLENEVIKNPNDDDKRNLLSELNKIFY